ncbi:MAG: PspC domain-containing protein [Acutalibacteraceae bacterium]|nr:PspC domain-containing protein [Acutalibacteraceae bacterium]MEE1248265.1 PspC domain-containing protein [Lachnospiraceae bacterium]
MGKKLYRDTSNEVFAGVCSGLANYFGIDVTIVRLLWAIFTLAGGCGIIAYIIAVLIIPSGPSY